MKVSIFSPVHAGATTTTFYVAHHLVDAGVQGVAVSPDNDDFVSVYGAGDLPDGVRLDHRDPKVAVMLYDHYVEDADVRVLVVDNSYRSLRKIVTGSWKYDFVLCAYFDDRVLGHRDVMSVLNVDAGHYGSFSYDARVQRSMDAGLLASRLVRDGGLFDVSAGMVRDLSEFVGSN